MRQQGLLMSTEIPRVGAQCCGSPLSSHLKYVLGIVFKLQELIEHHIPRISVRAVDSTIFDVCKQSVLAPQ